MTSKWKSIVIFTFAACPFSLGAAMVSEYYKNNASVIAVLLLTGVLCLVLLGVRRELSASSKPIDRATDVLSIGALKSFALICVVGIGLGILISSRFEQSAHKALAIALMLSGALMIQAMDLLMLLSKKASITENQVPEET
jgi:hypothetical protein